MMVSKVKSITLCFLLLPVLASAPKNIHAQEQITLNSACTTGQNTWDWDQIVQCASSVWARAAFWLGTATTCNSTTVGLIRWSGSAFQVCNGAGWSSLALPATVPSYTSPPNSGYFVMTSGSYNGNLSGSTGANATCLTELTSPGNNWQGYSTANSNGKLTADNVYAFICSNVIGGQCAGLMPNATYAFALVGDATKGGATFTTDSNGRGPNDSANWSGATYFGGSYNWWSNRGTSTNTAWGLGTQSSTDSCSSWTASTAPTTGRYGATNNTISSRWNSTNQTCNNTARLICVVGP